MAEELRIAVSELRRRIGARQVLDRSIELLDSSVAGTVVGPGPVELTLVVESALEGVVVSGRIRAPWSAECRRCLEPMTGELDLEVREVFEARPTPGETYPILDDHIDLVPMVLDVVLPALPGGPLCDPGCAGPDPARYPAVVEGDRDRTEPDPRWAALSELRLED